MGIVSRCNAQQINRDLGHDTYPARGPASKNAKAQIEQAGLHIALFLDTIQW